MRDLVLLSGGLDSALCLRRSISEGRSPVALGFHYGQDHAVELLSAEKIARGLGVNFYTLEVAKLEKSDNLVFVGRNLLFIASAIPMAVSLGCDSIVIGANSDDSRLFPDCRVEFMQAVSKASEAYGVSVRCPLLNMTKKDIVGSYMALGGDVNETWTCYSPNASGGQCGVCHACRCIKEAM